MTTPAPATPPATPASSTPSGGVTAAGAGGGAAAASSPPPDTSTTTSPTTTTALGGAADAAQTASSDAGKTDGKQAEGAPAPVELKFPEGFKADAELVEGFKALAQESGLKGEHAQKLADLYVKAQQKLETGLNAGWEKTHQDWKAAQQADKEVGGAAYTQNLEVAKSAIKRFGDVDLQALMNSPFGDHPALVRFAYRVGKALQEDSSAGTSSANPTPKGTAEEQLRLQYPTMFKE